MARRLNRRLVVSVLVFIGVPAAILIFAFSQGWFSTGNAAQYFAEAKQQAAHEQWGQAWITINNAVRAGGGKDPEIQYLRAQIAMHQNPPAVGVALKAYQSAVAQKPDFVEAQRELAELYLAVRYWKEGKTEIGRLIEMDPSFGKAYLWGAVVEMALADAEPIQAKKTPYYEAAIARCQAGLEKAPDLLDLYRMLAQVYDKMGRTDKIDEVIDLAMTNNPAVPEAYLLKAARLLSQNRSDEAVRILKKGMEKIGEDPKLVGAMGEVALRKRDLDMAREYFTKALAADPKNESSYLRLATMYRMDAERQKALEVLSQGLANLPESVAIRAEVADLSLELGDIKKADAQIAEIEKAMPEAPVVNYLRGKESLIGRQVRQAITYLEKASESGGSLQARLLLGRAYLLADELGAAQRVLEGLTTAEPGLVSAWQALAEVQFRLRDFDKAGRSAKVVLESNPDDTQMRLLLAQALVAQKRLQEALKETQTAAERAKDNPDPYLLMADIYRAMNRPAEAEEMYRRAIGVGQDVGRAYQRLIEFLRATNQKDKIQPVLDAAKKTLSPDDYAVVAGEQKDLERELKERAGKAEASPTDLLSLGRFYQLTGQAAPAKEVLSKVLAKAEVKSGEWRQAWQQLFLLHLAAGEYDKASELIGQLKQVDPEAQELLIADPLLALGRNQLDEAATQLQAVAAAHKNLSQAHFLLGRVLAQQQKWDEAVAALSQALETRPNLVEARLLLGRIYLAQGNLAGAVAEAGEALKYDSRLVPAMDLKAAAQVGLGAWDAAMDVREQIRKIVPDNVENLIALAALYLQRRQAEKAEGLFKQAYQLAPDSAVLVRAFANFYVETGRPREGEAIVDGYISRHKDDSSAYVVRGEFTARASGPAEAEPYFQKAADLAPTDPNPLIFLGDQYAMVGQWDKASAAYLRAIERAPQDMTPRKRLADTYMLQGQLADAKTVIEEVLKHAPKDVGALVVAGRIAARQGRPDEAKKRMEEALALDPHYGEAIVRLAELYVGPDPMRALDMLARVDPTDPSFEKAMLLRSDINTRRALLTDAVLDLRRLLDFRPTSVTARRALASKYMAMQKPDLAAEMLAQLSKEYRDQDPVLLVSLGDAYQAGKRYADALGCYEKALALRPELVEALVGEARVLVAMNRKSEAVDRVHHVMDLYPNEVWPRVALVEIYERSGEPDKAAETLRTALLRRENWEEGYIYLADLLGRAKKLDESRQVLLTGLNKLPQSLAIRASLAAVDMLSGQSQEAQEILQPMAQKFESLYNQMPEELEKLRPYTGALQAYSLALYNVGRIEEALKYGMMLWKVDPTNVVNANNTAWILATEKKDFAQAMEMIQRAMKLVPNHPQVLDTAGWIAFLGNRYEEAANYLLESIKAGDNAEAHYHLGRLYEARQRPEEARQEYQKAVQMGLKVKDKADAEKRLERLSASPG